MNGLRWMLTWRGAAIALVMTGGFTTVRAAIPEPDLVLYGAIRSVQGGVSVRLTQGTLSWTVRATAGPVVTLQAAITNINDQFSYVLRVPCQTLVAGLSTPTNKLTLTSVPTAFDRGSVLVDGVQATIESPATAQWTLTSRDRGRLERVDLLVSLSFTDADGDGLPDDWERTFFGAAGAVPGDDPDRDGASNFREYIAGTNPTDAQSVFEFIDVARDPSGGIRVTWSSVASRQYQLERSADVMGSYAPIASAIAATPPQNTFLDSTATGPGSFFYRLRIAQP